MSGPPNSSTATSSPPPPGSNLPPKRAKRARAAGPHHVGAAVTTATAPDPGAFPNFGVSLRFLARILADPRLARPMHTLPLVGTGGRLTTPRTDPELEALGLPRLRTLAKAYRVFSAKNGESEFARYNEAQPIFKACDSRHPLEAFETEDDGFNCDGCNARGFPIGTTLHGCRMCDFDICEACHEVRMPINGREELLGALRKPPSTTTHVCLCIIKPDTLDAKRSYAAMLRARGEADGMVGRPTIFLSHAWRYTFRETVAALLERFEGASEPERLAVRVWIDIFVEDQNTSDAKPERYYFTAFKDAVAQIGHTVLVLAPWDNPIPITRAWCLWEIYSTLVAGSEFEVVISRSEIEGLRAAVLDNGENALTNVMVDVDAKKAEAFDPADRAEIFRAIEHMAGGFHKVNVDVKRMLRTWILGIVRGLCADDSWTDDVTQRADLYVQVGAVLREYAEPDVALVHLRRGLAIHVAAAEPDPESVARAHNSIGLVLADQGDLDGTLTEYRKCLAIYEATLGRNHPHTATLYSNIGAVLTAKGDFDGALTEHRKSLAIEEATLGLNHPNTARSYHNIGAVLEDQGDLNGALTEYRKSLAIEEATLGPNHPDTSRSYSCIGNVLVKKGDLDGAFTEHRKALAIREATLGADHPNTVNTRAWVEHLSTQLNADCLD